MKDLPVHPATLAWWEQRQQCVNCTHCKLTQEPEGARVMRCRMFRGRGRGSMGYCIDARLPSGPCKEQAVLFKPRTPG